MAQFGERLPGQLLHGAEHFRGGAKAAGPAEPGLAGRGILAAAAVQPGARGQPGRARLHRDGR